MKIRPVAVELFHADGQMDGRDEANSRFSKFCERALKKKAKCHLRPSVKFGCL
jgi:hypothetical protein